MWCTPTENQLSVIPALYSTEKIALADKTVYMHFFIGGCDWYICEYDGQELFWGFACLGDLDNAEWGYISYAELKALNVRGIQVDRDRHWKPCKAADIDLIRKAGKLV